LRESVSLLLERQGCFSERLRRCTVAERQLTGVWLQERAQLLRELPRGSTSKGVEALGPATALSVCGLGLYKNDDKRARNSFIYHSDKGATCAATLSSGYQIPLICLSDLIILRSAVLAKVMKCLFIFHGDPSDHHESSDDCTSGMMSDTVIDITG
jgi:hypothetical protein